jgi:hypothetical protein
MDDNITNKEIFSLRRDSQTFLYLYSTCLKYFSFKCDAQPIKNEVLPILTQKINILEHRKLKPTLNSKLLNLRYLNGI